MNSNCARAGRPTRRSPRAAAAFVRPCAKRARRAKPNCSRRRRSTRDWFLRCGTTTMEAKSGYGLSLDEELKILRVDPAIERDDRAGIRPDISRRARHPGRICRRAGAVCRARDPRNAAGRGRGKARRILRHFLRARLFRSRGLGANSEGGAGARSAIADARRSADEFRGAFLAARLGAATADHLEQTNDAEIAALAEAGVQPVLLPASVYALGKTRYPKARAMIEAGLAVVLATDFNPGSSPTPSIPMVLSLACTQMKMTPAEGITASDDQCRLQPRAGRPDRLARSRQSREFRRLRLRGLPRDRLLVWRSPGPLGLHRRRLRLFPRLDAPLSGRWFANDSRSL